MKELRGQTIVETIYMEIELTENYNRNSVIGSNSEPSTKIFKE